MNIPILQIVIFQVLFLAIYDLFLQKETFFNWNRWYLLVMPILSITIPFIKIPMLTNIASNYTIVNFSEVYINSDSVTTTTIFSYNYLKLFFIIGIVISTGIFIRKLIIIFKLIAQNRCIKKEEYTLVILPYSRSAFSFFNYIFIGHILYEKERAQIISHELVHCKSKHTIDLLIFEFLKIAMWFNPLIYVFHNRIQLLHEYIADDKVLQRTIKKESYFNHLLSQVFDVNSISFINQFYKQSFLKKRIMMATKNKSKQVKKVKYLMAIPVVVMCMLFYVSCNNAKRAETPKIIEEVIETEEVTEIQKRPKVVEEVEEEVLKDMPFALIKKAPIFPGCEGTELELKKCLEEKIKKHIAKEFNKDLAGSLGLSPGMKRISVLFKIDKTGNIVNVRSRAPHKALQDEAVRIVKTLPKMIPGKYEGKNVGVMYSVPIIFKVE